MLNFCCAVCVVAFSPAVVPPCSYVSSNASLCPSVPRLTHVPFASVKHDSYAPLQPMCAHLYPLRPHTHGYVCARVCSCFCVFVARTVCACMLVLALVGVSVLVFCVCVCVCGWTVCLSMCLHVYFVFVCVSVHVCIYGKIRVFR